MEEDLILLLYIFEEGGGGNSREGIVHTRIAYYKCLCNICIYMY